MVIKKPLKVHGDKFGLYDCFSVSIQGNFERSCSFFFSGFCTFYEKEDRCVRLLATDDIFVVSVFGPYDLISAVIVLKILWSLNTLKYDNILHRLKIECIGQSYTQPARIISFLLDLLDLLSINQSKNYKFENIKFNSILLLMVSILKY